jgi:small subunit ribosomal protein S3
VPAERVFIKKGIKRSDLEEFLEDELERAGYGGVDIKRTPTGTRVTLYVERPGIVIGRKGKSIQQLTDELARRFDIEKPQVEVSEIDVPELNAQIMAHRTAFALSRGRYFRRVGYSTLRRIMKAGARGAEILISGKLSGEHARFERFYDGYLKKAGEPASRLVSVGHAVAKLKAGVIGVKVMIMPPNVELPDEIKLTEEEKPEGAEEKKEAEGGAKEKEPEKESLKGDEEEVEKEPAEEVEGQAEKTTKKEPKPEGPQDASETQPESKEDEPDGDTET